MDMKLVAGGSASRRHTRRHLGALQRQLGEQLHGGLPRGPRVLRIGLGGQQGSLRSRDPPTVRSPGASDAGERSPGMQALLLAVTLGLAAVLQAQDPLPLAFEPQDAIGTWHVKAVVVDEAPPWEQKPWTVSPVTVTALDGGDLEASFTFMKEDQCHRQRVMLRQTQEPGRYSAHEGKVSVSLQRLPVQDHFLLYAEGRSRRGPFRMGKLLGRNSDENLDALAAFRESVQRRGLAAEGIFMPAQMENCSPASE
ncbi:odorant-binding protein 2b [Talpa occidentalis]|uniref:odorant-binding protein 2b n=1 Tax=Talpa occidentalis TaxID=50954 RepID=UPI00188E2084|nr:odorant-binding protein 2b [Talpa occidentalis]